MASALSSSIPLKGKLNQVKNILEDANRKLQEEASKHEIFTTRTSAVSSGQVQTRHNVHDEPTELFRTISDINNLKLVLSCPIFNRIVNVTDTLDQISYQLNLHPSIGPSDINIDANGELILSPPIEPTFFNNLVNGQLDAERMDSAQNLQHTENQSLNYNAQHHHQQQQLNTGRIAIEQHQVDNVINKKPPGQPLQEVPVQNLQIHTANNRNIRKHELKTVYSQEKLVAGSDSKPNMNGNRQDSRDKPSLKHEPVHQDALGGNVPLKMEVESTISSLSPCSKSDQANQLEESSVYSNNGYSNELYKTAHELAKHPEGAAIEHQNTELSGNIYGNSNSCSTAAHIGSFDQGNRNHSTNQNDQHYIRKSCSPSTSIGSTVRLADECDSGASSYQSAKVTSFNDPINSSSKTDTKTETKTVSMEQEPTGENQPEMERIKVTLEKDQNGLGITIAGYTCEEEEISGIFVKCIAPGSPADLSAKIRTLDQIFAVNGRELLGISNPEAVNILRNTGKVITLELMRCLAQTKYQKLQTALAHAVPSLNAKTSSNHNPVNDFEKESKAPDQERNFVNQVKPPFRSRVPESNSTLKSQESPIRVKVVPDQPNLGRQPFGSNNPDEHVYNNSPMIVGNQIPNHQGIMSPSHVPITTERSSTNKVIETMQGARNTVVIKTPVYNDSLIPKATTNISIDQSRRVSIEGYMKNDGEDFNNPARSLEPEWERNVEFVELYRDSTQGLGFTVKDYADPRDQSQSILMIKSITPGGIADRSERLACGDLLIFVDDTDLKGASLDETVRALKRTNGQVRLGVLKLKRINVKE